MTARPKRSRIHSARHVLGELRRLLTKLELAYGRSTDSDERQWIRATGDALERQIRAGEAGAVKGFADPRPGRTVRKRQRDFLWEGHLS